MSKRLTCAGAALAAALGAVATPAQAHVVVQTFPQAEQRAPNGRMLVERAVVSVIICNAPGEGGGPFYIYGYVNRPGFRAILPPNWSSPIGGRDFASFDEAAGAACHGGGSAPPLGGVSTPGAAARGSLTGNWGAYDFVQTGDAFTWRAGGEFVQGTVAGDDLVARWPNGSSLTGRITGRNAQGDPIQLTWANGVVMSR